MSGLGEPAANQARCLSTRAGPWCLSRWSRPVNHVGGSLPPAACTACPISLTYSAAWARVQNAHSIRTVVVDQPRPPLGAILHRADRCRPFQSPSMRFHQRCLRKALGLSQARKGGNLPCADLPAFCARDLPHHQRLDFGPLASYQMHHRSICDSAVAGLLPQAPEAPPARDAPPPPRTPPALLPLLPASLAALSPCSPGSPPDPGGTPALAQTASSSPTAPAFPLHVALALHSAALNPHKGGKKASPTLGAGAIRARQLHRFSSRCLDEARLLSTCQQRLATRRTPRTLRFRLLAPLLGLTHLDHVLDQLRP